MEKAQHLIESVHQTVGYPVAFLLATFAGKPGHRTAGWAYLALMTFLYLTGSFLTLTRHNAHDPPVRDRVVDLLGGHADFLFIDADHSLSGIRRNLALHGPLVKSGGLIALHDVLRNPRWPEIEIWQLWAGIRELDNAGELVDSASSERPLGIGLIQIRNEGFQPVQDILDT